MSYACSDCSIRSNLDVRLPWHCLALTRCQTVWVLLAWARTRHARHILIDSGWPTSRLIQGVARHARLVAGASGVLTLTSTTRGRKGV